MEIRDVQHLVAAPAIRINDAVRNHFTFDDWQQGSRRAWLEFFDAKWDEEYIATRERIGEVHAQLQIEPIHYLASMHRAIEI
jgi:hypothetical protein